MSVLRPPGGDAACQSVTLSPTPCSPTPCAPEQGCHIKAGNTQAADIPQVQPVVKELGGWVFPSPVLLQPRIIINWGRTRTELRQEPRCSSPRASSRPLLSWGILGPPFQSNRWAAEVSGMGGVAWTTWQTRVGQKDLTWYHQSRWPSRCLEDTYGGLGPLHS